MTTFAAQITEAKCSDLHRAVKSGDDRHLCFTRLSGTWLVCVTDGVSLWRTELDEEEEWISQWRPGCCNFGEQSHSDSWKGFYSDKP
ncbi:hypothetical protein MAR_002040 [Mya arenaria]|uniref:Uncharacterized protein n=1 Tax=Mya arenaria TaxID=6604 RepID=A0ABY7FGQ1_MYAAR|nr:hypothetical protein MAR_002040 [Mya arenaria]